MSLTSLLPFAGLILCSSGGILLNVMRLPFAKLAGIVLLYLGGSVLLLRVCSFQMAAALFVCGVGCSVLLGTSLRNTGAVDATEQGDRTLLVFRGLLAFILGILAFMAASLVRMWIPVRGSVLFVILWIFLMGLVSLSLDTVLLFRCLVLQSFCLSFTLGYVYLENSVLVFSFLTVINLMMSFGCSMLIMDQKPTPGPSPEEDA